MDIQTVNNILKQLGKPAAKAAPQAAHPLMLKSRIAALKQRVADMHKSLATAFAQAQKLKATKIAAQIHELSAKLVAMETDLNKFPSP